MRTQREVQDARTNLLDDTYYLPTRDEVKIILREWRMSMPGEPTTRRWDCDDYAKAFSAFVARSYRTFPTEAESIAVFTWIYLEHALNMFMTTEGDIFIEPQSGTIVATDAGFYLWHVVSF